MNANPDEGSVRPNIRETKLVLLQVDLAGYTRAAAGTDAVRLAHYLDDFYRRVATAIVSQGGRVVKFIGDACLAVFPVDRCADAVEVALALEAEHRTAAASGGIRMDLGANVHMSTVAEGELGADGDRRYDVIGSGVNHVFRMGGGAGVRISEPVYRQLPSERRGPWEKEKPPATYRLAR